MEEPDIKRFSDEQLTYLVGRQKDCKDLILKARYSHILWLSRVKKIDYAKDAVNSYLELAQYYKVLDIESAAGDLWLRCLEALRNALLLSLSVGYMANEVKQLVVDYALNYPPQSKACSVVRKSLVELMHEQKNAFQKTDFVGVTIALEQVFEIVKGDQLHHAVEILDLIVLIEQKLGNDLIKWKRLIAEFWEKITYQRGFERGHCYYKLLHEGDIGRMRQLEMIKRFLNSTITMRSCAIMLSCIAFLWVLSQKNSMNLARSCQGRC